MIRFEQCCGIRLAFARLITTAFALLCSVLPTRAEYLLAPGDVVDIVVAGVPDWRPRASIQSDGTISLPVLGTIHVAGLSASALQVKVEAMLATKMFRQRTQDGGEQVTVIQPGDVAATIAEYRPVYVKGDVLNPGAHSYRPSMTVRQVVALSGGYSVSRRVLALNRDPVELEGDYKFLWSQLAQEGIHAQRLQAELEDKEEFEPRAVGKSPVPASTINKIVHSEMEALKIRHADIQQEKAFLTRAIKQADEQRAALTTQQEHEGEGLEADTEELDKVRKLFAAGNMPSPRVSEIRRAVLLSSTRRLQTAVELIQIKKQQAEFERRLEKLANDRKSALLQEMSQSSLKLAELGSKLEIVGLKLGLLSRAQGLPGAGEPSRPEIMIIRNSKQKWTHNPADEDSELEPGDVIDVTFRSEDPEVLARAPTSSLGEELDPLRSATEAARIEQKQALDQERDRADAPARELTSRAAELDKARISGSEAVQAAEAERKQKQALDQERGRADALARELTSVRAELDAARTAGSEAVQAAEAQKKQKEALEQERGRAEALARDLTSLRAELDVARVAGSKAVQATEARRKQKQALDQERSKAEALGRELTSLRAELDTARGVHLETVQAAEAAKVAEKLASAKERDKIETLARELASARKEAEERSALFAAAHAEVLLVTETNRATAAEQKQALASERDRADALSRELTSVRNQLEADNRQIAALNAQNALATRESAVDSSQERMAESSSRTIPAKQRSPEQISGEAAASTSIRSSAPELPPSEAQSTAREPSSDLASKVAMATERSTSASASRSLVDEQRLLARANTFLRQADISGARLLLEHALERGSARAAFMLAETYDARVLRSWHAHGIAGDLTKARELYERAQAGGIEEAKERLETLKGMVTE